jgi:hypothetical protein
VRWTWQFRLSGNRLLPMVVDMPLIFAFRELNQSRIRPIHGAFLVKGLNIGSNSRRSMKLLTVTAAGVVAILFSFCVT